MDKKDFHKIVSALYGITHNVGGKESYLFAATFVEQYYKMDDEVLGCLYRNDSELTNNRLLLGTCVVPMSNNEDGKRFDEIVFYRGNAFMTEETYSWLERRCESNKSKEDYEGKFVIEIEVVYIHHYYLAFWYADENGELRKCRKEILVGDMTEALDFARKRVLTGLSSDGFKEP